MMTKKFQHLLVVPVLGLGLGLLAALILMSIVNPEPVAAQATTVYVRLNGNDLACNGETNVDHSAPVAPDCAFATIQHAIGQVATGGTVNVTGGAGTYTQALTIGKPLSLVGAAGATVSINQNTICATVVTDSVTIDGMSFADCDIAILAEDPPGYTNLHIINNTIHNTDRFGIYLGVEGEKFNPDLANDPPLTTLMDFTGLEVTNNIIFDIGHNLENHYGALVLQGMRSTGPRHNISGNEIYSVTNASAIWIDTAQNISVRDNHLHDNLWGIYLSSIGDGTGGAENGSFGPRDIEIIGNSLRRNTTSAVRVIDGWPAELSFQYNALVDTSGYAFYNHPFLSEVTAQNNWWGCNAGPNNDGCDYIYFFSSVHADPWLVLDLAANPAVVQPAAGLTTVTLTATLTHNSDGVDTSGSGHIPDGTEVAFESSVGAIDPPALTVTTLGVATATIPIDPTPGTVVISATVDHQVVTATIHIPNRLYYFPIMFKNSPAS